MTPGSVAVAFLDDGNWSASFGLSYRDVLLHDVFGPRRIVVEGKLREMRKFTGTGGIVAGRNLLAATFLDSTDAEWLFMVDTDMGFAGDTVERLLAAADPVERPVVGALCFALKQDGRAAYYEQRFALVPTLFHYVELSAAGEVGFYAFEDYPRDELVAVAGTGAACLLVHRTALEAVRAKHGAVWFDLVTHPTGDRGKPRVFSEDLSFCIRLADVDVPVHVHTGVRTNHHKGGIFLTEAAWERQRVLDVVVGEPRISVLCPTRGRPEAITTLVGSALSTAAGPVELVFYVDTDDDLSAAVLDEMAHLPVRYVRGPRIVLSQMWNRCADVAKADVMMHCGDDIAFRTPGWDTRVLAAFEAVPDRIVLVHGDDGFQRERLATHGFLHRRWVEAVGYFVPPHFSSDYNDVWLTEVADALGRRAYLPDVVTEHMHPAAGKGEWDLTHRERLARHERDDPGALYASMVDGRAADVAKLKAVIAA